MGMWWGLNSGSSGPSIWRDVPSRCPVRKKFKKTMKKTSIDEQEARVLDRLRTIIAYIFSHVRHDVRPALFMAVRREIAWKPGERHEARVVTRRNVFPRASRPSPEHR